jgi:hypothetical protein
LPVGSLVEVPYGCCTIGSVGNDTGRGAGGQTVVRNQSDPPASAKKPSSHGSRDWGEGEDFDVDMALLMDPPEDSPAVTHRCTPPTTRIKHPRRIAHLPAR